MNAPASTVERIEAAVAALPPGPLHEAGLRTHLTPLFMRQAIPGRIYLANHSLGRPLDATDDDVREGLAAWYAELGGAWTWTVNDPADMAQMIDWGVDGIITDYPDRLRKVMQQRKMPVPRPVVPAH